MLESIPHEHWQNCEDPWHVYAGDPLVLTKVLDLPDLIVTGLEGDPTHQRLIVFCTHAFEVALCPTWTPGAFV